MFPLVLVSLHCLVSVTFVTDYVLIVSIVTNQFHLCLVWFPLFSFVLFCFVVLLSDIRIYCFSYDISMKINFNAKLINVFII